MLRHRAVRLRECMLDCQIFYAAIAQLVERVTSNDDVRRSNRRGSTRN
jgi:hypothetical protein